MLITVFTPTYNRAHLLTRLYESLKAQSFQDFEWIIVDDGSTDNTEELINEWIQQAVRCIGGMKGGFRYIKQSNGGKHRAINRGVQEARGELFFIVDSDDILPKQSLERVAFFYNQIRNDSQYAGVCGLRSYFNGDQIGGEQLFDTIDCSMLDIRQKYKIKGDMAEVVRTEIMRQYPFPEIEGEKFCPEALVWNRIAQSYVMRYFHESVYLCEYLPGGLTDRIVKIRMDSPQATMQCYKEMLDYNISIKSKIRSAINFWRFRPCLTKGKLSPTISWQWLCCQPIGYLLHIRDKKKRK